MLTSCYLCKERFGVAKGRSVCNSCSKLLTNMETFNPFQKSSMFDKNMFVDFADVVFEFSAPPQTTLVEPLNSLELLVGILGVDSVSHFTKTKYHSTALLLLMEALEQLDSRISKQSFPKGQQWKGILLAPEFFFHQSEDAKKKETAKELRIDSSLLPHRCLSEELRDLLVEACKNLSNKYPSILIVPGSFLYRKSLNKKRQHKALSTVKNIYGRLKEQSIWTTDLEDKSTHFVGHSATGETDGSFIKVEGKLTRDTIEKTMEKISHYEYMLRNTVYGFYRGKVALKYHKIGLNADIAPLEDNQTRTVFVSGGGSNIVDFNGVRLGVEICLDHDLGLLKKLNPSKKVDLHLIISGSVDDQIDHFCQSSDGFVIHADSNPEPCGVHDGQNKQLQGEEIELKTKVAQNNKLLTIYSINLKL